MYDKVNLVSEKSRQIARKLFPEDSEKIVARLQYLCEIGVDYDRMSGLKNTASPENWERVCFAVLKASEGSRDEFERVVKCGKYDIKDVLPMAGFAESLTIHKQWGDQILKS